MANTLSAAKNARKAARRHERRVNVTSELKTLRKKAIAAAENKTDNANELVKIAAKKIAKAAANKYIHPKTASRKISRLIKTANRLQAE